MERQGVVNCFRMCRVAVFLAVLVLLAGHSWGACRNSSTSALTVRGVCHAGRGLGSTCNGTLNFPVNCPNQCNTVAAFGDGTAHCVATGARDVNCNYWGTNNGIYFIGEFTVCDTKCEADSVANYASCIAQGNRWQNCECVAPPPPDPADCKTRQCCDSMNVVLPIQTDTSWLGCVPTDLSGGCSAILDKLTPGDTAVAATCSGKTVYKICTTEYVWDGTNHCRQLPTANCAEITVNDSMCTDVVCYAVQQHFLSDLDFNELTQCYTGTESVQNLVQCTNGVRGDGGSYDRPFTVCQSYLDAHGMTIGQYISGRSGVTGGSGGISMTGGGGISGGGGSGGGQGGCVGNGCNDDGLADNGMPAAYGGGESVDAQGNTVQNSPSPGLGGTYTNTSHVATTVNPSTGEPEIIKNSSGDDSVYVANTFTQVQCIGFSHGYATLTDGFSTWTCEALSCSQALFSASLSGGRCSGESNGITVGDGNPNSPIPTINGDTSGYDKYIFQELNELDKSLDQFIAAVEANMERARRQRDSLSDAQQNERERLWKQTFGDNLDYVWNIDQSIQSASSANSQAISGAVSNISTAVGGVESAVNNVRTSVNNASTNITTAVGNASTNISGAVASGASNVSSAVGQVKLAVNDVNSSIVTQGGNIKQSVDNVGGYVQATTTTLRDTVHQTNEILRNIESAVSDTGPGIPASIWSVDSNLSSLPMRMDSMTRQTLIDWSNDKLVMMIDTNLPKIVSAIDTMKVDVSLDSISVIVEHDTILDSIRSDMRARGDFTLQQVPDSINFGSIFQQGFDSAKGDTSFVVDSSFVRLINSVNYIDGGDFGDDMNIDSLTSEINRKLDSSNVAHNARSDSMTAAYVDTMMKYSGLSTGAPAVQQFFAQGGNDACPRNCLDLSLTNPFVSGAQPTRIQFSTYLCDLKIFANYSVLDFIKLILRLMTSLLCLMFIWSSVGKRGNDK